MKTLYFVQHGIAEPQEVNSKRPLSESGINEVYRVAAYLRDHYISISKIYHSGKLRAQQTAALFSETLAIANMAEMNGLNPNDDPLELINQLTEDAVMYVGHLPNLAKIVTQLVSADKNKPVLQFQNSAVVCIEIDSSSARIKWFITPSMC